MAASNLNNGYIYPQTTNVARAKAIQSGYITDKKMIKGKGDISEGVKNRKKAPINHTPMTKNPIKHSGFLPKQVSSVSKNVGNAPARGFGR